ncbi:mitofusin [Quaeritorhiza haematococci]|nr:mitofusin [Quaeritorhiza haematococci]
MTTISQEQGAPATTAPVADDSAMSLTNGVSLEQKTHVNGSASTSAREMFFNGPNGSVYGLDASYEAADNVAVKVEQEHAVFAEKRSKLLNLITSTKSIVEDLKGSPLNPHILHYPAAAFRRAGARFALTPSLGRRQSTDDSLKRAESPKPGSTPSPAATGPTQTLPAPQNAQQQQQQQPQQPRALSRSSSSSSTATEDSQVAPLNILQINMKGYEYSATKASPVSGAVPGTVIDDVTEQQISSQLLHTKLQESLAHLDRLRARISDTRSRVLVTGDLNAGKSTFVNAMLRREIVPDDQQPCTALFAEVVDADQNDGIEEVHGIRDPADYKREDPTTFTRFDLRHLRRVVEENEEGYELLKVYCRDRRERQQSLLHNGVVDISLIDSPGLNIDSIKTTALFAQQEEIDVVVFVVNAENHLTLSGKEFLAIAGKEKAYIFIVVNKFDHIRRKDRCRKEIFDQIQEISPLTFADAENLVHFVSAKQCLQETPDNPSSLADFMKLEDCLRSFILEKRSRSKLAPAKIYLQNVLSDIIAVAKYNSEVADRQAREISREISDTTPAYEGMLRIKERFLDDLDRTVDETGTAVAKYTRDQLQHFTDNIQAYAEDLEWNGVLYAWQYARDLRNTIYRLAVLRIRHCEEYSRERALACVEDVERLARTCMDPPPAIDLNVLSSAFDTDPQKLYASLAPPADVEEFFDTTDKMEILKEYLPAVGLFVGGIAGYKRLADGLVRGGMFSNGKTAFAGMAIAGVGLFLYVLSDMRRLVLQKVTAKTTHHLLTSSYASTHSDRIAKASRRVLRLALWEFSNQFSRTLQERQRSRGAAMEKREREVEKRERFEGVVRRAETVAKMVGKIDLDEGIGPGARGGRKGIEDAPKVKVVDNTE